MRIVHVITIYVFICSLWNSCSTDVQGEGCTLYDVLIQVLQYPKWSWLATGDNIEQRYKEVIDSLYHLCNNIEPGTNTRYSDSTG